MKKILMVCLGNICRSPLAEGILKSKVDEKQIFIDSAGTSGHHVGELPDSRSVAVANKYGIDITNQRSRKFIVDDFDVFDLIYVMDSSNYDAVLNVARTEQDVKKLKMILSESNSNENLNVPDPYYGGANGFENVYQLLNDSCELIASKV